jgi:Icc-related predicted phosphoesterase
MHILDRSSPSMEHAGCPELLEAIRRVRPKLHVFGHVHGGHGMVTIDETVFVNAALLGMDGVITASVITLWMRRAHRSILLWKNNA